MTLAIGCASGGYLFYTYDKLPPTIVSQFDLEGNPKSQLPKISLLLILFLQVGIGFLFNYLPIWYPLKKENSQFNFRFTVFGIYLQLFMFYLTVILIQWNLGNKFSILDFILLPVGLLFVLGGWAQSVSGPNNYIGIRTQWTMENEKNWDKVNGLGVLIMYISGALTAAGSFMTKWVSIAGFIILIVGLTGLSIYAWVQGRKKTEKTKEN